MSDFQNYLEKQAKLEAASNLYNYAGVHLELAHIKARLAELKSQWEPLATLCEGMPQSAREKLYAAAFYVVIGRFLTKEDTDNAKNQD